MTRVSMIKPDSTFARSELFEAVEVSVIVPIFNEEESIPFLYESLFSVLDGLGKSFEIICVNDGSIDETLAVLRKLAEKRKELKIVNFRRNYGQTAAMMAGIDYSRGSVIVSIDADLQNDPQDIPALLEKLDEGYDVVSGWRKNRQDAAIRRNFISRVANRVISRISGVRLHDYGCTLKAYRSDVVKEVRLYGEMHRFVPIYASWMGARVCEIPVRHHARKFGTSNYGLERLIKVILDLLVLKFLDRYLVKPIYIFGGFGLLSILIAAVAVFVALVLKFGWGVSLIQTPLPLLAGMTLLVGILSILLGLLTEIVVRTYFEARDRRAYAVSETVNVQRG